MTTLVYHGTSLFRAQMILQTGIIRSDATPIWDTTTRGFVYVTSDIGDACWYGKQAIINDPLHHVDAANGIPLGYIIFVFRWRVDSSRLLPDQDNQFLDDESHRSTKSPCALSYYTHCIKGHVNLHVAEVPEIGFVNASHPLVANSKNHRSPQRLMPHQIHWIPLPLADSGWIS